VKAAYRRGAYGATFVARIGTRSPARGFRCERTIRRTNMPPRDDELPEGTDKIINGAMETGAGESEALASGGGSGSGFIGASGASDTGGTAAGGDDMTTIETGSTTPRRPSGGTAASGGISEGGPGASGSVGDQLRGQVSSLRDQAGGKVREFADGGKTRASDLLEELSRVVADTAESLDGRLGNNYGEYARKASDRVSGFAESLRGQDVDQLYDNVRSAVRKSPGVAIGIAAVVGFTLVRLVKAGLPEEGERGGKGRSGGDAEG
jgi:ElaB/YqjD/DUF883 family membrane-anchored ribosome-binding protein